MFEEQSMINRLSNPINRNRSAAKISKVMCFSLNATSMPGPVLRERTTVERAAVQRSESGARELLATPNLCSRTCV